MNVVTLAEQLLFTTVRIEASDNSGNTMTGTGFVFSYPVSNGEVRAIVTNKHVVAGATSAVFTFTEDRGNQPVLGQAHNLALPRFEKLWFGHPDPTIDVAVVPLIPLENHAKKILGAELFYRSVDPSLIPTREQVDNLDAIEEVIFVGYPHGIWDTKNFLPLIRRGITASPITIDFDGQPKFLIDASVFPGSSCSPVFLYYNGAYRANKTAGSALQFGTRLIFLGVLAAVFFREITSEVRTIKLATRRTPGVVTKEMLDLGVVYKASTIVETIEALLKQNASLTQPLVSPP